MLEVRDMENKQLYELLEIPNDVVALLNKYEAAREQDIPSEIYDKLFKRTEWEYGIKELQSFLGDDPDGSKILWEQLNIVSKCSYDEYVSKGISKDIFVNTMKFVTRFLYDHHHTWGTYKYVWAWWFPRQMSLSEYRIGALEYEFVDGDEREIAVHIPADADMSRLSVQQSLSDFYDFRNKYYEDWKDVKLTCDTWMLMPELEEFLGEDSNIVAFQKLFDIEYIDREATWYMGWIFPGYSEMDDKLPEKTLLQRRLKKYILEGNKFGVAKGHIK